MHPKTFEDWKATAKYQLEKKAFENAQKMAWKKGEEAARSQCPYIRLKRKLQCWYDHLMSYF